jgi:hypothetical protein
MTASPAADSILRLTKAAPASSAAVSSVAERAVWVAQAASVAAAGLPAQVAAGLGAAAPVLPPPLEAAARALPLLPWVAAGSRCVA